MYKFNVGDIIERKDGKRFGGIGEYSIRIIGVSARGYCTETAGRLPRLWVDKECVLLGERIEKIKVEPKPKPKSEPRRLEVFWMIADSEPYPEDADKVTIQRHKFTDEQKAIRTAAMLTQKTGRDYFILKTTKLVKHVHLPVEVIEV